MVSRTGYCFPPPVALHASIELSRSTWLVTSLLPGTNKMSKHTMAGATVPRYWASVEDTYKSDERPIYARPDLRNLIILSG